MRVNFRKEMREWEETNPGWILDPQAYKGEHLYRRFCGSRVGYFLHLVGYQCGWHLSMIVDPLHCGGFFSHLQSWLWNLWHVDIFWPIKHRIDRWRRPDFYKQQDRFFRACFRASDEGCGDKMETPPMLAGMGDRFHGVILGERYFKRVREILEQQDRDAAPEAGAREGGKE